MASDQNISEYLKYGTEAFVILKSLYPLLPTQNRDEVEARVEAAENAFQHSNVALAKAMGYKICECTLPGQIMLWQERQQAHVCPRAECGHKIEKPKPPTATFGTVSRG
jgi:hypothetical protein